MLFFVRALFEEGDEVLTQFVIVGMFHHVFAIARTREGNFQDVADFPGTNDLRVVSSIGRRLTAHGSATGRTLLARLSDAEVLELYDGRPEAEGLIARLDRVRAQGFALSLQEATPGVDAIAIAVGDPATDEAVSLCIAYPHAVVDDAGRDEMLAALAEGAARIAVELGDRSFVAPRISEKGLLA